MTLHKTGAALMGLFSLLVSCGKAGDEPARREGALEQRISRLEAALAAQPARRDGATPGAGDTPASAGSPRPGPAAAPGGQSPGAAGAGPGAADGAPGSLEDRIDALEKQMARTLKTVRIPLELNKSGNEVCAEAGHACLTLFDEAGSARYDVNDKFCGHMVADCNARVTRKPHCAGSNDYLLSPVKFYRSPGIKAACDSFETETCESSPADLVAICLE